MSAQTGRPGVAAAPPSSRRFDRARIGISRMQNDPNPVWMRELRQAARLGRTPIILAVITGVMALLMCSVGGVASVSTEPAKVGVVLFHVFFSLAFAVVTWVAPAVAASTIASERSGRTWEALLLTGLGAPTIARGKFLASLSYISLYIVMLAPVGVLPFLFGGVTATEVITAFALLFLLGALSVAFGLSISSQFSSSAVAIVVTLLVAIPLSLLLYLLGGVALSFAAHELWPQVPKGPPVWLPTAYARADFGLEYVAFLVVTPLLCVTIPAWFFYEVTVANMASMSDDRSTGIRRWALVSLPAFALASLIPAFAVPSDEWAAVTLSMGVTFLFAVFVAFVFAGEPLGPSRRVQVHWDRTGVGRLRRYLGPGVMRASSLLLMLSLGAIGIQLVAGVLIVMGKGGSSVGDDATRVVSFGLYAAAFLVFVVGFVAWTRARSMSATVPRVLLVGVLFLATLGPWLAMAIAGILTDGSDEALLVASPSPTYVFVLMNAIGKSGSERELALTAAAVCAAGWGFLGAGLMAAAGVRSRRVIASHERSLERVEALLRSEEEPPVETANG
ncbi:MAG: ABC transporter permease [Myxococcales bacterium]|nr:ABC transporter permease [Myxococcales bacterium]MCB9576824.1 ABC transporter permease [Polyangiaceae bacterium]